MLHNIEHSIGSAYGAGTGVAVEIDGIKAGSTILAVVTKSPTSGNAVGRDPAAFTAADGSISSASIATTGLIVYCIWR